MNLITVNNQDIASPIWEEAALCKFKINNQVDIWKVDISVNLSCIPQFLKVLTADEITRANRYISKSDGDKFIVSRGVLRYILAKYLNQPAASIRFELTENKKPFIVYKTGPELHFNLSDSADKVLIAIAKSPVGIDVEIINPKFDYKEILPYNFNPEEINYIKLDDSLKRFYSLWTRKEAILKATGIGLTDHLPLIHVLNGTNQTDGSLLSTEYDWQLHSFEPDKGYMATVATGLLVKKLSFWDFTGFGEIN
jgi:4'-phosphopantetheinyl transferase